MEKTTTTDTLYDKFKGLISGALAENKSFACWSLPNETSIHITISDEVQKLKRNYQLEDLSEGFIFAPFDQENNPIYFIKTSFYWNTQQSEPDIQANKNLVLHKSTASEYNTSNEHYIKMVKKSVDKISEGYFEKVVPGRAKTSSLNEDFDVIRFFLALSDQYSDAFVSFVSIPEAGTWLGASPELLIHTKDNLFKTVALAGTQPYEPAHSTRETTWTQKEIEEQALVSRYIINSFKKIRLREFKEFGPKTVRAGNLLHLKTEFQVDMKATNYPDLGSVMVELLHPTSAVCGMPVEITTEFLKENEDFDRGFFTGYLGPVNIDTATDLFVNLRCLQIIDDKVITYAGAGVTIDSDPVKELNETEIKMNTLLRLLR